MPSCLLWLWGLNSGPPTQMANTLPTASFLQIIPFLLKDGQSIYIYIYECGLVVKFMGAKFKCILKKFK